MTVSLPRRSLLAAALACAAGRTLAATPPFEVTRTDAEWQRLLAPAQFAVLRRQHTERPFSSPLYEERRPGRYGCAGCGLGLFSSRTKFDSGTGWPSFWQALPQAVLERSDRSFGTLRTEALCGRCGGHLGHVFDDGPRPTGQRYCINGLALNFRAGAA